MDTIIKFIKDLLSKLPKWLKVVVSILIGGVLALYLIFGSSGCQSTDFKFKSNGVELEITPNGEFDSDEINASLLGIYNRNGVDSLWSLRYDVMDSECKDVFGLSYSEWLSMCNDNGYSYDGKIIYFVGV